jgi:processive 1,2-diacylglycerol beta-glucosyltransferase
MARVLLLTASYGSGHNVAARSLAEAFERAGATVTVVDHFRELVHPAFERLSRLLYYWTLRRAPALWGAAYALGDWMTSDSPLTLGVTRLGLRRLRRLLEADAPDAVVTVHATPSVAMATLAQRGIKVPPHTTVVTDFVAHSQWIAPRVDRYCVAAEEVKHEFVARGLPPDRIVVTGVPLRPEFEAPLDRTAARRAMGLDGGSPVVVAMAGALGGLGGRLLDVARALRQSPLPCQAVFLAGHDQALAARLRRVLAGTPFRVFGYVRAIHQLMAAADLLVTKAGGMTLAEALATETPLVLFGSLPGQERRNERFASRQGIALVARSRRDLGTTLTRALGEPELRERLRRQMRRLRRPDASRRIVDAVLEREAVEP